MARHKQRKRYTRTECVQAQVEHEFASAASISHPCNTSRKKKKERRKLKFWHGGVCCRHAISKLNLTQVQSWRPHCSEYGYTVRSSYLDACCVVYGKIWMLVHVLIRLWTKCRYASIGPLVLRLLCQPPVIVAFSRESPNFSSETSNWRAATTVALLRLG